MAATQKCPEEAIEQRVFLFLVGLNDLAIALHESGDLGGQSLIPQSPVEMSGELPGDFASATAVFALDGDDSNHGDLPRVLCCRGPL
jgi:hypothetical protein